MGGRTQVSTLETDCGQKSVQWRRAWNIRALHLQPGDRPCQQLSLQMTGRGSHHLHTTPSSASAIYFVNYLGPGASRTGKKQRELKDTVGISNKACLSMGIVRNEFSVQVTRSLLEWPLSGILMFSCTLSI